MITINGVTSVFGSIICLGLLFVVFAVGSIMYGLYMTRARNRYYAFTDALRRSGRYEEWSQKHRLVLIVSNFSFSASLISILISLGIAFLGAADRYEGLFRFFFLAFFVFGFMALTSTIIQFNLVPKKRTKTSHNNFQ